MKGAYEYLFNKLTDNDVIVAAISGGPDSMALLNLLIEINKEKKIKIICAHVNHSVREESVEEQKKLSLFCLENNVIFEYKILDKIEKTNFHNQAHMERQSFFEQIVQKYNANYLLTGHHSDDLIETILMRISRGSTFRGYAGFEKEAKRAGYYVLRPLIDLTKEELVDYCILNKISYAVDKSNHSAKYTRNRYRQNVIPTLKKENPHIEQKFQVFSQKLIKTDNFINELIIGKCNYLYQSNGIALDQFLIEHPFVQERVIYQLLQSKCGEELNNFNDVHVNIIMDIINDNKNNMRIDLPKNFVFVKEYGYLNILKKEEVNEYSFVLETENHLSNGKVISYADFEENENNFICRLDSAEIKMPLVVRSRKTADKMSVKGLEGTKKISDIFINEKVQLDKRKTWPIVTDSNDNIVWLPGLKKSKFTKTRSEKYDIILRYH